MASQDPFRGQQPVPWATPQDSARNSYLHPATPSTDPSRPLVASDGDSGPHDKSEDGTPASATASRPRHLLFLILLGVAVAIVVIVLVIILPVYFEVIRKHNKTSSAIGSGSGSSAPGAVPSSNPESPTGATWGGNGSLVAASNNVTFTYINNFGGYWVFDPKNPYNNSARAQEYTPALDEPWNFTSHHIQGVNFGGWLVIEPFITPAPFQKYAGTVDEWTLSIAMANDTSSGGGLQQISDHYASFITELDFAEVAGAGLNWIRLPIPFWAIETWEGEPFFAKVAWNYAQLAFQWARKYGLRIYLDLHTVPGSQNGYNHSGRQGVLNFMNGPMGIANAARTLDYIRVITEFISENQYTDVVQLWGVVNEPLITTIGRDPLSRFYLRAYDIIRGITGIGEGKGPYMVMHDGFEGPAAWQGFLSGADRLAVDTHPYVVFGGNMDHPLSYWPSFVCPNFNTNASQTAFGVTVSGEFSAAVNDCGLWISGVGNYPQYSNCTPWNDYRTWTDEMKEGVMQFTMAQMDAMHVAGYFFWTWKIGNDTTTGIPMAPEWSYQLGLQNGWIPTDPRTAIGTCEAAGQPQNIPFNGYESWQTGGAGAGTIVASQTQSLSQYPPPSIANIGAFEPAQLPFYTATSAQPTLTATHYPAATASAGDGWADASDTAMAPVPIVGCSYLDPWSATIAQFTSFVCSPGVLASTPVAAPLSTAPTVVPTSAPATVPTSAPAS